MIPYLIIFILICLIVGILYLWYAHAKKLKENGVVQELTERLDMLNRQKKDLQNELLALKKQQKANVKKLLSLEKKAKDVMDEKKPDNIHDLVNMFNS